MVFDHGYNYLSFVINIKWLTNFTYERPVIYMRVDYPIMPTDY